jgi:hypothetical protein
MHLATCAEMKRVVQTCGGSEVRAWMQFAVPQGLERKGIHWLRRGLDNMMLNVAGMEANRKFDRAIEDLQKLEVTWDRVVKACAITEAMEADALDFDHWYQAVARVGMTWVDECTVRDENTALRFSWVAACVRQDVSGAA